MVSILLLWLYGLLSLDSLRHCERGGPMSRPNNAHNIIHTQFNAGWKKDGVLNFSIAAGGIDGNIFQIPNV